MLKLGDHLALARMKLIRTRKAGLCFDPDRLEAIPALMKIQEWAGEAFHEFRKKVEQAKVLIFAWMNPITPTRSSFHHCGERCWWPTSGTWWEGIRTFPGDGRV